MSGRDNFLQEKLWLLLRRGMAYQDAVALLNDHGSTELENEGWGESGARKVIEDLRIVESLKQVLSEGTGFELHYQPQVDLNTGELVGAEALIRLEMNGETMMPVRFIAVAEEVGLIDQIGAWAMREACEEAKRWKEGGLSRKGIRVGVNLSVKQVSDKLADNVMRVLGETGLPAHLLDLEITESFILAGNKAMRIIEEIRKQGVTLSIDDFGVGYSCLSYLKDLPFDTIKIDRSFVKDLGREGNLGQAVVEGIILIARKMGIRTLAEGIETDRQAVILRELGCTAGQGYLYARALRAVDFERYARGMGDKGVDQLEMSFFPMAAISIVTR
ncbi:MAG: EAL domain-containing protein [Burkholderiales bacterium]